VTDELVYVDLFTCISCSSLFYVVLCVCRDKALKDELLPLNNKLSRLGDIAGQLSTQLSPVAAASVADSKLTLDRRANNLQSQLQQQWAWLESSMDERSKYDEKYRVIDMFLKSVPSKEARPSAVNVALVQQNLSAVKELLARIENLQPEMRQLNELGREVSLTDDETDRLAAFNERWEVMCREKDTEVRELEQRLVEVQRFTERCEEWSQFVNRVEDDVQLCSAPCSYESLCKRQQNIEVT